MESCKEQNSLAKPVVVWVEVVFQKLGTGEEREVMGAEGRRFSLMMDR